MGPRLELELVKIQEGLAGGAVLYHRFEQRTAGQAAAQEGAVEEARRLRAERRLQQEENVQRKAVERTREQLAQQVPPLFCSVASACFRRRDSGMSCVMFSQFPVHMPSVTVRCSRWCCCTIRVSDGCGCL